MIWQKQPDNSLTRFSKGEVTHTDGTKVRIGSGVARVWADTNIAHLNAWNLFKPTLVDSKPTPFDPDTEVLEGPTEVVTETTHTRTWTKRARTVQELADEKVSEVAGISRLDFEIYFSIDKRLRDLKGDPVITKSQFKKGLEVFAGKQG
jgi:hypothetical protein